MRVALTGAHGVGKSTFAEELAAVLHMPVLSTPGRELAASGLPVSEAATVTSQTLAWLMQYRFEREQSSWVAPRSLIDIWAYTVQAAERNEPTAVEHALLGELQRVTRIAIAERYDQLLYLPPRIPLQRDGVRPADPEFQRATDAAIMSALTEWQGGLVMCKHDGGSSPLGRIRKAL
jgi:nicotinamide riboside kinase